MAQVEQQHLKVRKVQQLSADNEPNMTFQLRESRFF